MRYNMLYAHDVLQCTVDTGLIDSVTKSFLKTLKLQIYLLYFYTFIYML